MEEPVRDRDITASLLDDVGTAGGTRTRVWRPGRQISFGPRDVRHPGYTEAVAEAKSRGYSIAHRSLGGRPVAFTENTVAILHVGPVHEEEIGERYDRVGRAIARVLGELGVDLERGSPPGAFCPGSYGLAANGKIVGLAQRVRAEVAAVGAVVIIAGEREIADVLAAVYGALDLEFDPETVGSIQRAGGEADPDGICARISAPLESAPGHRQDRTL